MEAKLDHVTCVLMGQNKCLYFLKDKQEHEHEIWKLTKEEVVSCYADEH